MEKVKSLISKIFPNKYHLYLALLILLQLIFYIVFVVIDKSLPTWDSAGHIGLGFRTAFYVKNLVAGVEEHTLKGLMQLSDYYPPFMAFFGAAVALVVGYNYHILLFTQFIFFALLLVYMYKLINLYTKDEKVAFISTVVFSLFPQVVDQTHYYHLDIPLVLFLLMATYYLLKSQNFAKYKETVLFFIFFAFSQLIKWYGFLFLIVPVMCCLIKGFVSRDNVKNKITRFLNILSSSFVFIVIAIPWYVLNWKSLLSFTQIFSVGESDDPLSFIGQLLYYPGNTIGFMTLFIPFVLIFVGLYMRFMSNKKIGTLEFFYVFVPYITFSII